MFSVDGRLLSNLRGPKLGALKYEADEFHHGHMLCLAFFLPLHKILDNRCFRTWSSN